MNQTEATRQVGECLKVAACVKHVTMGQPIEKDHPDVLIVTFLDGLTLSVTVEVLAAPHE